MHVYRFNPPTRRSAAFDSSATASIFEDGRGGWRPEHKNASGSFETARIALLGESKYHSISKGPIVAYRLIKDEL